MKTCKSHQDHQCNEGSKRNLLVIFTCFGRFLEGTLTRKFSRSTGSNGQLKRGKLLILIENIGNKTQQFQFYCFKSPKEGFLGPKMTEKLMTQRPRTTGLIFLRHIWKIGR